eukprot:scaffold25954_cov79-Isochrysis_galbana.AAC.1
MPAAVDATLRSAVGPAAEEALRSAFASTLIPGYEMATKTMFGQVHAAFVGGTEAMVQGFGQQVCALSRGPARVGDVGRAGVRLGGLGWVCSRELRGGVAGSERCNGGRGR